MEVVLGSGNAAKRRMLRWLLEGLPVTPIEPDELGIQETARDLAGNAELKALAYSRGGRWAIASDGGLEVAALGASWDPVKTGRLGRERLRQLTHGLQDRRLRWREAVALAHNGQLVQAWEESRTEGRLTSGPWPEAPSEFWVWEIFEPRRPPEEDPTWLALKARVQAYFRAELLPRPS